MALNLIIRKAKESELKIVQDLNYRLFLSDYDKDTDLNVNWAYEDGEEYFKKMISGEIGVCLVAEVDTRVVGYLAGCIVASVPSYRPVKRSELENMFVEEEYRSQGIGASLAKEFMAWSKNNGAVHCIVTTYCKNESAVKFYKKVGFEPISVSLEAKL